MPYVTITRLLPADVWQVQDQTASDALITEVIESLQSNVSTELRPLNTACPTCQVSGTPTGFLSTTVNGQTVKYICTTCNGNLRVYTEGGVLDPPVNPFEDELVVTRLLPADLLQAKNGFVVTTLDTLVTALQGNIYSGVTNIPLPYDCPLCTETGWVTVQSVDTFCPLCKGYQKTVREFTIVGGVPTLVVPDVEPPDPPLTPPVYPPV